MRSVVPSRGSGAQIQYNVSDAATVTTRIYNVAGRLVAVLASPYYKANPENRWADFALEHLRPWAVPGNSHGAVTHLWEGLPRGMGIPWHEWAGPLFWWFTLFFALFVCMPGQFLCLKDDRPN